MAHCGGDDGMPALRRISRDFLAAGGPALGASSISRDFLAPSGPTSGAGPAVKPQPIIAALAACLAFSILTPPSFAEDDTADPIIISGSVTNVVDGDTFDIGDDRIRLAGFDAPERYQRCLDMTGAETHCGRQATELLTSLVDDHVVACTVLETDRYGRSVCSCEVDGVDIGEAMVLAGVALNDPGYVPDYAQAEQEARDYRRGMHDGTFVTPKAYRGGDRVQELDDPLTLFVPDGEGINNRKYEWTSESKRSVRGSASSDRTPKFTMRGNLQFHTPKLYESPYGGVFEYDSLYLWAEVNIDSDGDLRASAWGDEPPADLTGSGTATWIGTIIGILLDGIMTTGDAAIVVDLDALEGDARFTDIGHFGNLRYGFDVEGNTFESDDGEMAGSFFGDEHQGVGGVVIRPDIVATFGAERIESPDVPPGGKQ